MIRDLLGEAFEAVRHRFGRNWLTALGVAVGVVALTGTIGVAATVSAQVSGRFDALQATSVTFSGYTRQQDQAPLERLARLHGVVAAGQTTPVQGAPPLVSRVPRLPADTGTRTAVIAATPSALAALQMRASQGRLFDEGHEQRRERVALIGDLAAAGLGLTSVDGLTVITIGGHEYAVLGVVTGTDPTAALSVFLPDWVVDDPDSGLIFREPDVVARTVVGAARQIGQEGAFALAPQAPESISAAVPPDPNGLRRQVETDTRNLFLALALVSVLVAALGVSNTMLVAVMERRHEIGIRRALGATRPIILSQILVESGALGSIGGVAGTLAGIDITFGVSLSRGWTAALPPSLLVMGPALGLGIGLIAGVYPALRAVRVEPVSALRDSVSVGSERPKRPTHTVELTPRALHRAEGSAYDPPRHRQPAASPPHRRRLDSATRPPRAAAAEQRGRRRAPTRSAH